MIWNQPRLAIAALLVAMAVLQGCTDKATTTPSEPAASAPPQASSPITIVHKLGTTVVQHRPQRVACLLYTSPSPRDQRGSRMPSSA